MAYDKLVDSAKLDGALKSTADAIRAKTGGTENIPWSETEGFKSAVEGITAGGGSDSVVYLAVMETSLKEGGDGAFKVEQYLAAEAKMGELGEPDAAVVPDMTKWSRNTPASAAFVTVSYNPGNGENICHYNGVGMFEVIGIPLLLEAGKTYTFTVQFYTPNTLTGDYSEPYAPYIAFVPYNAFNTEADPFPSVYAHAELGLSTADYITYTVTYTPSITVPGGAVFVMGSTRDGIPAELRLKNVGLTIA